MKSWVVHYKNKYPGGHVNSSEDSLDVYDNEGSHVVALRKAGGGIWVDKSEELGAIDKHDLSPIPKNARVHKLYESGKIGLSEEAKVRHQESKSLVVAGKIHSISEYKNHGFEVDDKGNVKAPVQKVDPAKAQPEKVTPVDQDPELL